MFSTDDTIVAIATPPGRGGIGIVRVSGREAERMARLLTNRSARFRARRATYARLGGRQVSTRGASLADTTVPDQVLVTFFPAPHSYTGEDVIEISAHGSPVVLEGIVRRAMDAGARLAEPGEFTLRAFLHDKLDLIQAEAVADLIDAVTPLQARAAFDQLDGTLTQAIAAIEEALFALMARLEASLDFPDEGYHFVEPGAVAGEIESVMAQVDGLIASAARGRLIREGARVAIVGAPNVGKSSLFNALLNANRAIVTAVPGTTRDLITERADVAGLSIALIDSAGIRDTADIVEEEGVKRARAVVDAADLLLVVLDRSRPVAAEDEAILRTTARRPRVVVLNKSDLPARVDGFEGALEVSVLSGHGLNSLAARIGEALGAATEHRDQPRVTNVRHADLLTRTREALARARDAVQASNGTVPEEFLLADLQDASSCLQEITGKRSTDDLLRHIFERFCIGK
jgi:tRNA modification GTPase